MTSERLAEIERHLATPYLVLQDLEDCVAYIYQLLAMVAVYQTGSGDHSLTDVIDLLADEQTTANGVKVPVRIRAVMVALFGQGFTDKLFATPPPVLAERSELEQILIANYQRQDAEIGRHMERIERAVKEPLIPDDEG